MIVGLLALVVGYLVFAALDRVPQLLRTQPELVAAPVPAWRPSSVVVHHRDVRTLAVLAWAEGWRTLRHPLCLAGFTMGSVFVFGFRPGAPGEPFVIATGGGPAGFWLPPLVFFAANLTATRSRRSGTTELFAAAPVDQQRRTLAACLGALVPAVVTQALVLAWVVQFAVDDVLLPRTPTVVELTLLPLSVLGAGTLGVMVARWAPWRGSSLVVFVLLVALSLLAHNRANGLLVSYVDLLEWDSLRPVPGSAAWHAAYVLGLDAMAVIGAVLRDTPRRRQLLAVGADVTLATAGAGWAQLP